MIATEKYGFFSETFARMRAEVERDQIVEVLIYCRGNNFFYAVLRSPMDDAYRLVRYRQHTAECFTHTFVTVTRSRLWCTLRLLPHLVCDFFEV